MKFEQTIQYGFTEPSPISLQLEPALYFFECQGAKGGGNNGINGSYGCGYYEVLSNTKIFLYIGETPTSYKNGYPDRNTNFNTSIPGRGGSTFLSLIEKDEETRNGILLSAMGGKGISKTALTETERTIIKDRSFTVRPSSYSDYTFLSVCSFTSKVDGTVSVSCSHSCFWSRKTVYDGTKKSYIVNYTTANNFSFPVQQGHSYNVSISDQKGWTVEGTLTLTYTNGSSLYSYGIEPDFNFNFAYQDFYYKQKHCSGNIYITDYITKEQGTNESFIKIKKCRPIRYNSNYYKNSNPQGYFNFENLK